MFCQMIRFTETASSQSNSTSENRVRRHFRPLPIYSRFHTKLSNLNQPWLSIPSLQRYAAAVAARGAPLQNCWGFIDGTVQPICRPTMHQREVYNGHKRQHGIKFQSIMVPNGLVANLFGPMEGRRHDAALLNESGVLNFIEQNFNVNGNPLCLYGDPAYPLRPHLMRPYRGGHLTPEQQAFNTDMASVRQAVEWGFGKIISEWAFLDHKKNLKLFLSPVGKLYLTGAFLANCHTCMYGSSANSLALTHPLWRSILVFDIVTFVVVLFFESTYV